MALKIQELSDDHESAETLGYVVDGEVKGDDLYSLLPEEEWVETDEAVLKRMFSGPYVFAVDADEEEIERSAPDTVEAKAITYNSPSLEQMKKIECDYDKLIKYIDDAIKQQVWPDDLTKAPRMWAGDENVPEYVEEWIDETISLMDPMWDDYDGVPQAAAKTVQDEIRESLTQHQGWSTTSIVDRLTKELEGLGKDHATTIARQEVAAVLNAAKKAALRAKGGDIVVRWTGPDDADTTEICKEIKQAVEERGGAVPLQVMEQIIREKAKEYTNDGGTPNRAEELVPHFKCRHTIEEVDIEDLS